MLITQLGTDAAFHGGPRFRIAVSREGRSGVTMQVIRGVRGVPAPSTVSDPAARDRVPQPR
jgi:hypothetical protein